MFKQRWDRDVRTAMKGRPAFSVNFTVSQTASSLWDYAEDELIERALGMSTEDLAAIQRIAAVYEDPTYPLPLTRQTITHNHVNAFAAIAYFEGRLRPLAQTRRRPQKNRPPRLEPRPTDSRHG